MTIQTTSHTCPHCKKATLKEITQNGVPCGYYCPDGCNSVFDFEWRIIPGKDVSVFVAKRRNPKFIEVMDSDDWVENLKREAELRAQGESTYTDLYPLSVKPI